MHNQWFVNGNHFSLAEITSLQEKLEPAIYRVGKGFQFHLEQTGTEFEFPHKIYGKDDSFVDRVVLTYKKTEGNLGILLNGLKGTGKTVTAKRLANALRLPVLVITQRYDDLALFLNEIQQDVMIFMDEFEKMYDEYNNSILTVMDGVLSNKFRKVFVLTTNRLSINENMLQRPGRLRYVYTFHDLDKPTIEDIVKDLLQRKEFSAQVIEYLSTLETISIDICKAVIEEVNIHNQPPAVFKKYFNTRTLKHTFDVYERVEDDNGKKKETGELVAMDAEIQPWPVRPNMLGKARFYANGVDLGTITKVIGTKTIVTKFTEVLESDDEDEDDEMVERIRTFDLVKLAKFHQSFQSGYDTAEDE